MLLLNRNTPKSSAPVKLTGLVQLNHLTSKPPFIVCRPVSQGDSVGNLPVVLCQRLLLALAEVRVAGDLDRGEPVTSGGFVDSSVRPSVLMRSGPRCPVVKV